MNLLKDLWAHVKEWSDRKMKDWIKAGSVAVEDVIVITGMSGGAAQCEISSVQSTGVKA